MSTFALGARVRLTHVLERYPHFIAEEGALGTVTDVSPHVLSVRMDDHLPGAEEWDNEIIWSIPEDDPADDLAIVYGPCPTCGEDHYGPCPDQPTNTGLCPKCGKVVGKTWNAHSENCEGVA